MAPTLLDKLVSWVDPQRGLARHVARLRLQRAYEAASPRDPWKPRRAGASANADHLADAATIRAKARMLVQNVPYIESGLEGLVSQTIGTGLIPRATGPGADKINARLDEWFKVCDADGHLNYVGLQVLAYRAMEQDGEVLIRLRPRRPTDGLPIPLQLQVLEIDWLDSTKNTTIGGNQVISGIEYGPLGEVVNYWLWDQHPGDVTLRRGFRTQSRPVPAQNIIHLFDKRRPGQARGISRFASVIVRARDLQLYEDAEQARKNLEARLSVLASPDITTLQNPGADGQPIPQSEINTTGNLGELTSGGITRLPAGTTITTVEPKPAGGYEAYVKLQLHIIAAGMGITYEMLVGDVSEVNFSSARVRLLDFRRAVEQKRWVCLIPCMVARIHRAVIDAGDLIGAFPRNYAFDVSPPKWDYVNPEQDVKADIAEISVGLASISEKLRMRGYDPAQVAAEIAADKKRYEQLGILEMLLFKEKGKLPGDPTVESDAKEAADKKAAGDKRLLEAIACVLDRMDTRLYSLEQRSSNGIIDASQISVPDARVPASGFEHGYRVVPIDVDPDTGLAREFLKLPLSAEQSRAADAAHPITIS